MHIGGMIWERHTRGKETAARRNAALAGKSAPLKLSPKPQTLQVVQCAHLLPPPPPASLTEGAYGGNSRRPPLGIPSGIKSIRDAA